MFNKEQWRKISEELWEKSTKMTGYNSYDSTCDDEDCESCHPEYDEDESFDHNEEKDPLSLKVVKDAAKNNNILFEEEAERNITALNQATRKIFGGNPIYSSAPFINAESAFNTVGLTIRRTSPLYGKSALNENFNTINQMVEMFYLLDVYQMIIREWSEFSGDVPDTLEGDLHAFVDASPTVSFKQHLAAFGGEDYSLVRPDLSDEEKLALGQQVLLRLGLARVAIIKLMVGAFVDYSIAASLGELRHIAKSGADRSVIWRRGLAATSQMTDAEVIEVMTSCVENFKWDGWGNSYGGKAWAGASAISLDFMKGDLGFDTRSNEISFIDRIISAQHNTGSFLNKRYDVTVSILDSLHNLELDSVKEKLETFDGNVGWGMTYGMEIALDRHTPVHEVGREAVLVNMLAMSNRIISVIGNEQEEMSDPNGVWITAPGKVFGRRIYNINS